jgi:hypothetical protein
VSKAMKVNKVIKETRKEVSLNNLVEKISVFVAIFGTQYVGIEI